MIKRPLPSAERLRELFTYSPRTGELRWKVNRAAKKIGDIAGNQRVDDGYIVVGVDMKLYRAHLLIWKMMTGADPIGPLDHRDTVKNNNRWKNLRLATKSFNQANIGLIKSNKSGFKGVSRYKQGEAWGKPWQAGIGFQGKRIHIGHYATKEEAHEAYLAKAKELFGEFARAA